jgi:hypothetical protein
MPNSFGYRARTRDMFKRNFKGTQSFDPSLDSSAEGSTLDYREGFNQALHLPHSIPDW